MKTWTRRRRLRANAPTLSLFLPLLSGCSVFLAASGKEDPDVGLVRERSSRQVVESVLGQPISATPMPDGTLLCEYQYEAGKLAPITRSSPHMATAGARGISL
jgi:hypothetical protein